jgi:DNA-directed RNA polymerase subunit H
MAEKSAKKTKKAKPPAKPKAAEKKVKKKPEPKKATKKAEPKKAAKAVEEIEPEFKVIEHEYVPLHELMPEDEVKALLERHGLEKHHLPKILSNDPAIRQDGLARGDVVKITRTSQTAGTAIYYRVVV